MTSLRVAVIGGGVFGVTAAVELARDGHRVELFEQNSEILAAASGINQYRLHRGYHYPRSAETALGAMQSEASFRARYGDAVVDGDPHYYAIARHGSRTSPEAFLSFCDSLDLEYEEALCPLLRPEAADLCVRVRESAFDPVELRAACWRHLEDAGVDVHLGTAASPETGQRHDFRVIATYAALGTIAPMYGDGVRAYQFEVCEKPVLRLPGATDRSSLVVLDGPFACIDPLGRRDLFVMGHVVHAIHATNTGITPEIPAALQPLLNRGIVETPGVTRLPRFLESARDLFLGLEQAEHVGSMFTVRTVLPDSDDTDARPTLVRRIDDRTVAVFSGKIGTCVAAAEEIAGIARCVAGGAPVG